MRCASLRTMTLVILLSSIAWASPGCNPGRPPTLRDAGPPDGGGDLLADSDGDTITDVEEGIGTGRDSDGDGTPDYMDSDSDADGIPDADEAGDDNPESPPIDSDGDGTPDYLDTDSDDNGIGDADERMGDVDGDGIDNFADLDDDGDQARDTLELSMGGPDVDSDMDGAPDYQDPDSDDDNILDGHEYNADTDEDGIFDYLDLDSDDDGLTDMVEAGDSDLSSLPVDTDEDGTPDFQDLDSDNDGLSDREEVRTYMTSPTDADSDGDGVSDLIEVGAGTDPGDGEDSPRTRGDFVFIVPYEEDPDPARDTLAFETSLQFADLYFSFDTTTSMRGELDTMAGRVTGNPGVPGIIDRLQCTETTTPCSSEDDCGSAEICNARGFCAVDPRTAPEPCIPDIWTGIGTFTEENTYRNRLSVQGDPAMTAMRIPGTSSGSREAPQQAAACVARPDLCGSGTLSTCTAGVGCPGFREDAVRILVQITDADDQCGGCYSTEMAGMDLASQGIKFISLVGTGDSGGTGSPESIAREIGVAAGSVDSAGEPYVFEAIDAAVVDSTVDAVRALVNADNFRVTIEASELPDDDGDAVRFIDHIEVNVSGTEQCTEVTPTEDSDGDGYDDVFPGIRPGTPVCWDVVPVRNMIQEPATTPLVYRALLTVRADGSEVDSRTVFFLVPPRIEGPGGPD